MTTDIMGALRREGASGAVRLEHLYDTDPADLWSALTDPARLARWIAPVEGELCVGGEYHIFWDLEDPTQQATGTVLECLPPERFAVTWIETAHGESRITVEVRAEGSRTLLVLDHSGVPIESAAGFGAGWQAFFERLEVHLRNADTDEDDWDNRWQELLPAYRSQIDG